MPYQHKIILTTDDFGPQPAINEGILELVRNAKVNSVNVLINYFGNDTYKSSAENVKALVAAGKQAEEAHPGYELQIGCHFTITSGKPTCAEFDDALDDIKNVWVDEHGNFRDYVNMRRAVSEHRPAMNRLLKAELIEQHRLLKEALDQAAIGDYRKKVSYFNSHHNAVLMWKEYSNAFIELAKEESMSVRSVVTYPKFRDSFYKQQISIRALDDLSREDRVAYRKNQRLLPVKLLQSQVQSPAFMDGRHYGPIPGFPVDHWPRVNNKQIKVGKAVNFLQSFNPPLTSELLLHVAHSSDDLWMKDIGYSGINEKYTEGRKAEFDSLMRLRDGVLPEFGSWEQLR